MSKKHKDTVEKLSKSLEPHEWRKMQELVEASANAKRWRPYIVSRYYLRASRSAAVNPTDINNYTKLIHLLRKSEILCYHSRPKSYEFWLEAASANSILSYMDDFAANVKPLNSLYNPMKEQPVEPRKTVNYLENPLYGVL